MNYEKYLIEGSLNDVIVVDVQPMYKNNIYFNLNDFCNFLKSKNNILYFYNGRETVGIDTEEDIIDWLFDYGDEDLIDKLYSYDTKFVDKGYAFFRGWMDNGADDDFIVDAVKYMLKHHEYDSRDIDPEEWEEKFPDDFDESFIMDNIYIPDIDKNLLRKFSGAYLIGGGEYECLLEIEILMRAYNFRYKKYRKFIY